MDSGMFNLCLAGVPVAMLWGGSICPIDEQLHLRVHQPLPRASTTSQGTIQPRQAHAACSSAAWSAQICSVSARCLMAVVPRSASPSTRVRLRPSLVPQCVDSADEQVQRSKMQTSDTKMEISGKLFCCADGGSKTVPAGGLGLSDGSSLHIPFSVLFSALFTMACVSAPSYSS